LLALRLCSSTIFSCQPLFLLNAVSPAAPLIGIATVRLTLESDVGARDFEPKARRSRECGQPVWTSENTFVGQPKP
jgi:hypothetical protein